MSPGEMTGEMTVEMTVGEMGPVSRDDQATIAAQLGRPPRAIHGIAHRCPCGNPDVVATEPRLEDGTPFPTTFYLTCPRAASLIGRMEASGLMKDMSSRLVDDLELADRYRAAHEAYLAFRKSIGEVPEIEGVSAGGMPTRVKCLHVLAAHSLGQGPGVNPLGDEVVDLLGEFWVAGPCVPPGGSVVGSVRDPAGISAEVSPGVSAGVSPGVSPGVSGGVSGGIATDQP